MDTLDEAPTAEELAIMRKRIRLERVKQKKLDRKQRLLEKKKTLLRDYLAREIKYGQNTLRKYQAEWEKLLRTIALPRQIEGVELAQQNFERIMDVKDYIISCLMDRLRHNEDYYVMCLNMHISKVDEIISRFHTQMEGLRNEYDKQINFLTDKENEFIASMEDATNKKINHLKLIVYGMAIEDKIEQMNVRADYCAKQESEMDHQELMLLQPRIEFEGMLRYIWESKNEVFRAFQSKTDTWRKNYDAANAANERFEKLSSKQLKRIDNLNKSIRQLKNPEDEITKKEMADLNSNLKFFHDAYMLLKQKLTSDLKIDKHKHEMLVWISRESYSEMKSILHRGRNIVRLLQCCKRLETTDEKIRPFPVNTNIKDNVGKDKERMLLFWQKMGKVNTSRSALIEEKMDLKLENNYLMRTIENICVCLSCPKLPPICKKEVSIPFADREHTLKKYGLRNR